MKPTASSSELGADGRVCPHRNCGSRPWARLGSSSTSYVSLILIFFIGARGGIGGGQEAPPIKRLREGNFHSKPIWNEMEW